MAGTPNKFPENTYDMVMRFRVTLPGEETPEEQDETTVITGEETEPWPGVIIHDAELLISSKVNATTLVSHTAKEAENLDQIDLDIQAALDRLPKELPDTADIIRGLFARHAAGEISIDGLQSIVLIEIQNLIDAQAW